MAIPHGKLRHPWQVSKQENELVNHLSRINELNRIECLTRQSLARIPVQNTAALSFSIRFPHRCTSWFVRLRLAGGDASKFANLQSHDVAETLEWIEGRSADAAIK